MFDKDKSLEESLDIDIQYAHRGGLIPVVVQDYSTHEILMLGYINDIAMKETIKTGMATFWSTSRNELWVKGATSGDFLKVVGIKTDCDQDAVIYIVEPLGSGACHTKNTQGSPRRSCFYRTLDPKGEKWVIQD